MNPTNFLDQFFFGILPYMVVITFLPVTIQRYRARGFTYSSLSSQFLENQQHFWGLVPFHYGILVVTAGHLLALLLPRELLAWNSKPLRLYLLEGSGLAFAVLSLIGLCASLVRRMNTSKVRCVTSTRDWVLFGMLVVQIASGIGVAIFHPWGSSWFAAAITPYLWSVATLNPNLAAVSAMPLLIKFHIVMAYLVIGYFPFTRLVHVLVIPNPYLWRKPQVVRWYRRPAEAAHKSYGGAMEKVKGTPRQGLTAATLGFFVGFAAVALFGPTAAKFQQVMQLSPMAVGFLVAMPSLSGSLLRIPFSAWVDTTGGRKPFLVLLTLSAIGMAGLSAVVAFLYPDRLTAAHYPLLLFLAVLCGCGIATFSVGTSQVSYWHAKKAQGSALAIFGGAGNVAPGIFSMLIPMALGSLGLVNSYLIWLGMLVSGTALYWMLGRNAPYFQLRAQGLDPAEARRRAADFGQVLFPAGNLKHSLAVSARIWRTWALVLIYFTTFGGFIALTAWLPTYWTAYFGMTPIQAGLLTALYSILASLVRILGGVVSDNLREGGENTAILALLIMLMGSLVMIGARDYQLAIPGVILLAFGMGICNAGVFKIVPQAVPAAVGGAVGWVSGLGAFGGFAIPPMLAFAVRDLGRNGYSIGFVVFLFLALLSLFMAWILKYAELPAAEAAPAGRPAA